MQLLKLRVRGDAVRMLQELLNEVGYGLPVTGYFGTATDHAVRDFQQRHGLVVDGVVYTKTWTKLLSQSPVDLADMESRFLTEADLQSLAQKLQLEVALIKAVNAVESSGRGFFVDGRPKILFEGHIFWQELEGRGYNPAALQKGFEDVLYPSWTKKYYYGDKREWDRMAKAISVRTDPAVAEAAYCSASYGLFQIMGFHYSSLGYPDVLAFVGDMKESEGRQLHAFGQFMVVHQLVPYLKNHQWAEFAKRYNGAGYAAQKYDVKLKNAYERFAQA